MQHLRVWFSCECNQRSNLHECTNKVKCERWRFQSAEHFRPKDMLCGREGGKWVFVHSHYPYRLLLQASTDSPQTSSTGVATESTLDIGERSVFSFCFLAVGCFQNVAEWISHVFLFVITCCFESAAGNQASLEGATQAKANSCRNWSLWPLRCAHTQSTVENETTTLTQPFNTDKSAAGTFVVRSWATSSQ